jgi:hypothetical protein
MGEDLREEGHIRFEIARLKPCCARRIWEQALH